MSLPKSLRLSQDFPINNQIIEDFLSQYDFNLRCAAPGIIRGFNKEEQTVKVQLAMKEIVYIDSKLSSEIIPELVDVPIVVPRAGNFVITMPVKIGDECLVIFGDMCIDAWWKYGEDKENEINKGSREQVSIRRHDLSDGFAIIGVWSQPNVIEDYSIDALEIRTIDGKNKVQVKDDSLNVYVEDTAIEIEDGKIILRYKGTTVFTLEDGVVTVASDSIKLGGISGLRKLIDERILSYYDGHTHMYNPGPGSSTPTEPPVVPLTPLLTSIATTNTEAK